MNNGKIVGLGGKPLDEASVEDDERKLKIDTRLSCLGRFAIPRRMIQLDVNAVMDLLSDMVVVRAELIYASDAIEYIAISHKYFAEVPEGSSPPIYNFQRRDDGVFVVSRE